MALGFATGLSLTTGTNGSATSTASSPVAGVNSALSAGHLPGRCAVEFDQRVADRQRSGSSGNHCIWHGARDREHLARLREQQQRREFP